MIVNPQVLREELASTLREIEKQIVEVRHQAEAMHIKPYTLRDHVGGWPLIPLLVAKADVLHALTLLNQKGS